MGTIMKLDIDVNVNLRHGCICSIYRNYISGENACRALDSMMEIWRLHLWPRQEKKKKKKNQVVMDSTFEVSRTSFVANVFYKAL